MMTLLGAGRQVRGGLVAGGEDAGAFERDVDAEVLPGKLGRVLDRGDLELLLADGDGIAVNLHLMREAAVHAVVAKQVRIGLDRAEIVDGDHVDVLAAGFIDRAHDVAADAAKSVDCNSDSHVDLLQRLGKRCRRFIAAKAKRIQIAGHKFKSISCPDRMVQPGAIRRSGDAPQG